jgi:capsular polysaccharide biosynthesis protein
LHDAILLLPRNPCRYIYESIQFFLPKGVLELEKHTYVRVKNLYLPRPVTDSGRHDGTVLMGLKKFILSKLEWQIDDGTTGERIYISRANQRARKIQNELEVQELLKAYGFSIVLFENMPFQEQIAVMGKAKYVVSNHGANLTNILFMPEKAKVLEINKDKSPNLCYYSLASSINLEYFYQLCPSVCEGIDIDNNADLRVDINKLRENVEAMLRR